MSAWSVRMRRRTAIGFSLAIMTAALAACGDDADTTGSAGGSLTFKVSSYGGESYPSRVMIENIMAELEEKSDGRIKFDYYPGESLVKLVNGYDSAASGVVDIAFGSPTYAPDRFGIAAAVTNLPYNYPVSGFGKLWREPGGFLDLVRPVFENNGLHIVSWPAIGGAAVISSEPITKLEDMDGKLVRGVSSVYPALRAMGAEPVDVATADLYTALQRGTIDAAIITIDSTLSNGYYEVAPYVVENAEFYTGALPIVMNRSKYQAMPEDLRKLFDDVVRAHEEQFFATIERTTAASTEELRAKPGVTMTALPEAELQRWVEVARSAEDQFRSQFPEEWAKFEAIREAMVAAAAES